MKRCSVLFAALLFLAALGTPARIHAAPAQMGSMGDNSGKPLPSPPADASVKLNGKTLHVHYNSPSIRGRKIMGGLVPYGKVWRTGANPATLFKTDVNLKIGDVMVPAGTYTLYTLPSEDTWKLIINKQTGQWGTHYDQSQDLARIDMHKQSLPAPQERMTISFENTHGASTQLHVKWETTDVWVPITAQ